jgi:DNA-binding response OmpR family regulator
MNHKVLLAEDSLTIQKVIKITLANQPFDIVDCTNEDELFQQLPKLQPKIVLLDFNLSSKFTGYELTSKIKSMLPSTKVLLLLGTFDTVDEHAMQKAGASDKIVKPFDSNKFIAICKQLIETDGSADATAILTAQPEAGQTAVTAAPADSAEDQWTLQHTSEQDFGTAPIETAAPVAAAPLNPLAKEMSDWGMSIPAVIDDQKNQSTPMDLPPIIKDGEQKALLSKLISVETFQSESPGPELELELEHAGSAESDIAQLESLIRDEVAEDLWKVDEFEDLKNEVSSKLEEVQSFQPSMEAFDESLFSPLDEAESIETYQVHQSDFSAAAPDTEKLVQEMRSEMEGLVKKYVKEYMDQMFQKNVEKVSWEVIPDLAENLIRQELNKISNKILGDN